MNIIKVALSHFCCRTTVQSDSVRVARQGQKVKGQGHQAGLGSCSGQRGNVLSVGNCCYVAICRHVSGFGGTRRYGANTRGRGAGHIVSPRAQLVDSGIDSAVSDLMSRDRSWAECSHLLS